MLGFMLSLEWVSLEAAITAFLKLCDGALASYILTGLIVLSVFSAWGCNSNHTKNTKILCYVSISDHTDFLVNKVTEGLTFYQR